MTRSLGSCPRLRRSRGFPVDPQSRPITEQRTRGSDLLFAFRGFAPGKDLSKPYVFQINLPAS